MERKLSKVEQAEWRAINHAEFDKIARLREPQRATEPSRSITEIVRATRRG
jgi:hypothetical protein